MKLLCLFLFAASFQLQARVAAQTVTLKANNSNLEKVFREIHKQTGYDFVFNSRYALNAHPVSMDVKSQPLENVLQLCVKDQPFTYQLVDKTIIIKDRPALQQVEQPVAPPPTVRGRITNEKGEPVAGVSISIKGGKAVGVTSDNGEFTLNNIPDNATLVFSAVNIETLEVKLNGRTDLSLKSKAKLSQLADVQITANTGYQVLRPNEITGAVTVVSQEKLNQQKETNILARLNGVVPSLSFTIGKTNNNSANTTGITIRGLSTINGPLDPLIVIDNFIYEGSINNINPDDIESVTILKDAAATSIWGARAGNGVIVLTRKNGKFNQAMKVEYANNFSFTAKPDLYRISRISSSDFIGAEQFLYNQGYYASAISINPFTLTPFSPALEVFIARSNGQITAADSAARINQLKSRDIRDAYNQYFYHTGFTQQHSLNIHGGTAASSYLFGIGYIQGNDNLAAANNQFNAHLENAFKVLPNLTVSVSNYFTLNNQSSGKPAYNTIAVNGQYVPYLSFDQPIDMAVRGSFADTAGGGKLLNWKYNALTDYQHAATKNRLSELVSDLGIQYQPLSYLKTTLRLQYQRQQNDGRTLYDIESFYARNMINTFSVISGNNIAYGVPLGGILNQASAITQSQSGRGQLDFDKSWGKHHVVAIAGGEIRKLHVYSNTNTLYGYNDNPLTFANVDYVTQYPTYFGATANITSGLGASDVHNNYVSVYSNVSYTYNNRYSVSGSLRRDGSNLFGASTNDRWKPLWSIGGAWEISKEHLYYSKFLPYLRLRTTYGVSGNVDPSRTALPVATYAGLTSAISNLVYARIRTLNDPTLRWEQSAMLNFGLDWALRNRTVSGNIDYYYKKGSDLYGNVLYDYTAWGSNNVIPRNTANMVGHGLEISLNSHNLKGPLEWNTTILFNYQTNKTTAYLTSAAGQVSNLLGAGGGILPIVGQPLYAIAAYRWGGLDANGNPQGYVNGVKSTDYTAIRNEANVKGTGGNIIVLGSAIPVTFGSLINTFSYLHFELSFNIAYRGGYYFSKPALSYSALAGNGNADASFANRWQKPGDELMTNVPSFQYPINDNRDFFYAASEINVLKADHIRLQYVNLSYDWKGKLKFHAVASNLGILWRANKEGFDPDYANTLRPAMNVSVGVTAHF